MRVSNRSASVQRLFFRIAGTLATLIIDTIVHWAREDFIENLQLVRDMFRLLHRQYNFLGEVHLRALTGQGHSSVIPHRAERASRKKHWKCVMFGSFLQIRTGLSLSLSAASRSRENVRHQRIVP